jgi:hypothetical protein
MNKPKIVFGLLGAFLLGCVASQVTALVVPPARAGTSPQTWEYFCKRVESFPTDQATATFNTFGSEGWEMVAVATSPGPRDMWCFKRALP